MKERLPYIVYDYESSSADPYTTCPLEIAAIVLDPRTLDPIEGAVFHSYIKPPHILDFVDPNDPLIQDGALAVNGIARSSIASFPDEKMVWQNFVDFCVKYATGSSEFNRCISCGHNITNFDNIITKRLVDKYKTKKPFHKFISIDTLSLLYMWTEGITGVDKPEKNSFDYWREYLDLPDLSNQYGGAHGALRDIMDCAMVLRRFLDWKRRLVKKNPLKGSFAPAAGVSKS